VNLIDELHVALIPPRRRVSFLLGGVVSSSILRGNSETECLLEEVVDGLDDYDPFFSVKRLVVFFYMVAALSLTNIYPRFSTGNKVHKYYFGVWTLSGISMCFVGQNKLGVEG
jgi:fucose 4-O-acetylase-like acetyltransferase